MTEPDFSEWPDTGPYRILFKVDRGPVWVDMMRVFPGLGLCARRQDELALYVRAGGLRLEPWMEGTIRAWLRRTAVGSRWCSFLLPAATALPG